MIHSMTKAVIRWLSDFKPTHKQELSVKKMFNRVIFFATVEIIALCIFQINEVNAVALTEQTERFALAEESGIKESSEIQLDVELINQMDAPQLFNGCEVTSLAMLLKYQGIDVTKNELAEKVRKEPLQYKNGLRGDPRVGFVGDITGNTSPGYAVYKEPLIEVTKKIVDQRYHEVYEINGEFEKVIDELRKGNPVWCLTTASLKPTNDIEVWETPNGKVDISWSVHSVLITGFDSKYIYVNNPYGSKSAIKQSEFIAAWNQMGNQAFTVRLLNRGLVYDTKTQHQAAF